MNISLDSCILFDAIEDSKTETLLRRLTNLDHTLSIPLTVAGEVLVVCLTERRRDDLLRIIELCGRLDAEFLLPQHQLRRCCYCMDVLDETDRASPTDKTHLAYSVVYETDWFLTTDDGLLDFPTIPCEDRKRVLSPDELRSML